MMKVVRRRRSSRSRMRMEMNRGVEEEDDALFGWKKISNIAMTQTHQCQSSQKTKDVLLSCRMFL